MVNASGHIEQQLSKLQTQTADIATDLEALVDSYLQVLSEASKRQLVLAAYHVCTQVYPESFLALSLSQRNRLQQHLRDLGGHIQEQLNDKWKTAKQLSLRPAEEDGLAVIRQLFLEAASIREQSKAPKEDSADDEKNTEGAEPIESEKPQAAEQPKEKLLAEIRTLMGGETIATDSSEPVNDDETPQEPMQPAQLMRRQILIEKAIRDVLKSVSEKANELLQKANVMPEIPEALLAATSDAERLGHIPMKTPNLVRLSIKVLHESDKDGFENSDRANEAEDSQWPNDDADIAAAIITREAESDEKANELNSTEEESAEAEEAMVMPRLLQLESLPNFVLIHLRLSEIEFAETNVAVWRNRIRKKMAQLKHVGHAYKDAERQLAIAQAEDAWRASWTNG